MAWFRPYLRADSLKGPPFGPRIIQFGPAPGELRKRTLIPGPFRRSCAISQTGSHSEPVCCSCTAPQAGSHSEPVCHSHAKAVICRRAGIEV
jgi:hypothetical protein